MTHFSLHNVLKIVPTVGSATYRGHVILGDFGPEPENADDLGGEEPGGEAAIARATVTANFANSTVTGAATDFIGATFGPSLPTIISDDVTLQEGRDPVLSNGRRYTGSVTFNGSLDAGDRSGVTGTFTGTLRSNSHTFDLNEVATGEIRGADNEYLEIESNRITEGDNSREISVEFFGEQ